mmetsp:Transcript_15141/g.24133  ORF Transcript_15141/g.24133 Transcript_15141/m.24133 type:complete len:501 (+) Transcript_15141:176-1678(+)
MSGDGGGGGGGGGATSSKPSLGFKVPDWYSSIWPEAKNIPDAWLTQGLSFDAKFPLGIVQPKNGPCGVLAAVQAVLISQCRKKENFSEKYKPSDEDLADAVVAILLQAAKGKEEKDDPIIVCTWSGKVGEAVNEIKCEKETQLKPLVFKNIKYFSGSGGCVLVVYSAALTRGVKQIKQDIISEGGETGSPLTIKAHNSWLCTSELISLLIRGKAGGNVGAFTLMGRPHNWGNMDLGVGLLTADEFKNGIVVCDALKSPKSPVWILHGGDHFTTLWSNEDLATSNDDNGDDEDKKEKELRSAHTYTFYHWNGLPPGGPRLSKITVKALNGIAPPAPKKRVESYFKPLPGEIESVVQAHPEDRKNKAGQYEKWRWEVMLAVDDPTVKGQERPKDMPKQPVFEQGPITSGEWRCRTCYADRFKTLYFKLNPAEATVCQGPCKLSRVEAGWSIWMEYDKLPPLQKAVLDRREAPKIKNILWTKFPGAEITWEEDKDFDGSPPSA